MLKTLYTLSNPTHNLQHHRLHTLTLQHLTRLRSTTLIALTSLHNTLDPPHHLPASPLLCRHPALLTRRAAMHATSNKTLNSLISFSTSLVHLTVTFSFLALSPLTPPQPSYLLHSFTPASQPDSCSPHILNPVMRKLKHLLSHSLQSPHTPLASPLLAAIALSPLPPSSLPPQRLIHPLPSARLSRHSLPALQLSTPTRRLFITPPSLLMY